MPYEMCSVEKFYCEVTFVDQFVYYRLEISRGPMGKCDAFVQGAGCMKLLITFLFTVL